MKQMYRTYFENIEKLIRLYGTDKMIDQLTSLRIVFDHYSETIDKLNDENKKLHIRIREIESMNNDGK